MNHELIINAGSCQVLESNRIEREWEIKASLKLLNCQLVNINSHPQIPILTFGNLSLADISITTTTISLTMLTLHSKLTLTACFHELREFSYVDTTLFLVEVPPDHSRQRSECGVV